MITILEPPAEFNYLVLIDGNPDLADLPYIGARGGLASAVEEAHALKREHPGSSITIEVFPA